jgi:hypothetical protein
LVDPHDGSSAFPDGRRGSRPISQFDYGGKPLRRYRRHAGLTRAQAQKSPVREGGG